MIKIISIDELLKELPSEIEVVISAEQPKEYRRMRRLTVRKSQLQEVSKSVHPLKLWIPASYIHNYRFAVRAPFRLLLANIDLFMYPDVPASDADLILIKTNDEGLLLIDTDDEETYRRIAEELRANSAESVEIVDVAYIPFTL